MNKIQLTLFTTATSQAIEEAVRKALDEACIEYGDLQAVANQHPIALSVVGDKPRIGVKGVEKTPENECQVRYLGGSWVITDKAGDVVRHDIEGVIAFINESMLYITNETIFTEEYARRLWYKRKG